MERIVGDWSTEVKMTDDEAKEICRIGQGEKSCAFIVFGQGGFQCWKMSYPNNGSIHKRLDAGTMKAKGKGEWKGCAWETSEEGQPSQS